MIFCETWKLVCFKLKDSWRESTSLICTFGQESPWQYLWKA